MKKNILFALALLALAACSSEPVSQAEQNMDAQRFFDENFKKSRINLDGHAVYFIEYGSRNSPSYRFDIEHDDSDCKKCFATFD
jgi:uncharacterized protein YcfL